MRAWGPEVAAAGPQGNFPQLEMREELVPFGSGQITVFFTRPLGPAAGDERPMMGDHVFGVDRGVAHGGIQQGMSADFRGDVRGQPGPQGVSDEDSPEVMGPPFERFAGGGDLRGLRRRDHAFADVAAADRPVLVAVAPLEQERHGRAPGLLEHVIGADQRQGRVPGPDPEDDRGEDLRELRGDQQQPLRIGLGRGDLEHRHDLAGAGQRVGDEAVVGEFQHLLDADAGVPQDVHGGPRPERGLLLVGEVAPLARGHLGDVDAASLTGLATLEFLPGGGEYVPGHGAAGGSDALLGVFALLPDGAQERGQQRQLRPGPLVHPRLHPRFELLLRALGGLDRARRHPRRPPGRVIGRPPGDVLIEGPDEHQLAAVVDPRPHGLPGGVADEGEAFLPCLRDLR